MSTLLAHRRRCGVVALLVTVLLAAASGAGAQTTDQLFDDSQVRDLQLRLSQRDWDTMHRVADDTYYPADLTWNGVTVRNVGVRHRGLGSRTLSKPNILIDVNRYVDQRFLGLTGLVLDNAYTDPSMVREAVVMKVFAGMGLTAPREAHVRLFVNGVFAGVYVAIERIDRQFIERVFGAGEADQESGGHLLEYQWIDEYYFEDLGDALEPYALRFRPHTRETDAAVTLFGPVQALVRNLNTVSSDRFLATVGAQIDLVEVARFAAVQTCTNETDGLVGSDGLANFYLYRFRDGRPAVLLPWDADHAFLGGAQPVGFRMDTTVLTRRLMEDPRLRDAYRLAVLECVQLIAQPAATDTRGWLEREFERLFANIAPDVAADRFALFDYEDFLQEQPFLLNMARTRPGYLLCQIVDNDAAACPALAP